MADNIGVEEFGFVCPDWAKLLWRPNETIVEKNTDGTFSVVDHSLQTVIYIGHTHEECMTWLKGDANLDHRLINVTCEHCGETYFWEDGHPEGTLCPKFGIAALRDKEPAQEQPGMVECKKHKGVMFWWEDWCPKCEEEIEAQEDKGS